MDKEERKVYDGNILGVLLEALSYSLPYTNRDLAGVYYQGQLSALVKLSQMMVAVPVGGVCQPMITEEMLNEMIKEINNEAYKAASQSTASGYSEGNSGEES